MTNINIFDLHKNINEKKNKRHNSFQNVLTQCHNRITRCAENELYDCYYEIPEFIIGIPLYNLTDCVKYIYNHLQENGFNVRYIFPKMLFISWHPTHTKMNNTSVPSTKLNVYENLLINRTSKQNKLLTNNNANDNMRQKKNGKFILQL